MLFYIFICFSLVVFALAMIIAIFDRSEAGAFECAITLIIISIISSLPTFMCWGSHANDLGTIAAQHEIILISHKEVKILDERLQSFDYPKGALLNADSPVASIVQEISKWQSVSHESKLAIAEAKKRIEQRRFGPMSGVITVVGDYK